MNAHKRACLLVALSSLLAVMTGCAGARINVTADRSRYPISMSDAVRDSTGELHGRPSLKRVGELAVEETRIGILYSAVTPRSTCDISDAVNAQVEAVHGEAVINLTVDVSASCAILNGFPVLNALPIWPGCVPVTISGEIVRRKVQPPAPPPPAETTSHPSDGSPRSSLTR